MTDFTLPLWGFDLGPYLFIAIAGWLATDMWRWMGVIVGKRLDEESEILNWVRAVATALVAAVIAKQILYPSGLLAASPMALRVGAAVAGFLVFIVSGQRVLAGVITAMAVLAIGLYLSGF
jgi:branched-subunit amino acid transport protein